MASPDLRQMLAALIASPSVSCTDPRLDQGNRGVIDLLAGWLTDLGFVCEIQPVSPGKANLIATLGRGPGGLVLAGHTDTVPWDEGQWRFDPFTLTEADGRLYGLGTADMKGFFPLAIEAARDFLQTPLRAPLILLATCDEECSMAGARALVEAGKPAARFAVIGEPTSLRPLRMHKGVMMERVLIEGHAGHSSDPALGANALEAMNAAMNELLAFRGELQSRWRNPAFTVPVPTLNLGCIHGGDNPNRICPRCELQFDLRPLPGMDMDELRQQIRHRLAPLAPLHRVRVTVEPIYAGTPAMETPADSPLVRAAERLTGHVAEAAAFGTEGPFFRQLGMDALIFGPGAIGQAHQPDEFLALDTLRPTVDVLRGLIREFCL
ncbi:MAG TPA: acetylornithine deacetylase [Moraxellaceae bacterium]|nr:acetylornithine deacetylase [Moraxellaceae bacterium]